MYSYRARWYLPEMGEFAERDPLSYRDSSNLFQFLGYSLPNEWDPSGKGNDFDYAPGGKHDRNGSWLGHATPAPQSPCGELHEDECCENGKRVKKLPVNVINRSGGVRTGLSGGHIDLVIPDLGMVGYFGYPREGQQVGKGMGLIGHLNLTYSDWVDGPTARPGYIVGPTRKIIDGKLVEPVLSTICRVSVCPASVEAMKRAALNINARPGEFDILGHNCSTVANEILAAGGVLPGGICGLDNPQRLQDQLTTHYAATCFVGFTQMDTSGKVTIFRTGPRPTGWPERGNKPACGGSS